MGVGYSPQLILSGPTALTYDEQVRLHADGTILGRRAVVQRAADGEVRYAVCAQTVASPRVIAENWFVCIGSEHPTTPPPPPTPPTPPSARRRLQSNGPL